LRPVAEEVEAERPGLVGEFEFALGFCGLSASRARWSPSGLLSPAVEGSSDGDAAVGSLDAVGSILSGLRWVPVHLITARSGLVSQQCAVAGVHGK
jgi:hypothetical protein